MTGNRDCPQNIHFWIMDEVNAMKLDCFSIVVKNRMTDKLRRLQI
ncbi:hypothetical protein T458_16530 [Brevibacillus panacihumi W25]|uniref:Uncharacterized protein n=1 Tax=Brevibacillus panacihumi W25 TaxID=1408254 RepID=V6M670_9BACL|nr:hypothetical protein T458_16530 [Brevibacillus panacihumi W25]